MKELYVDNGPHIKSNYSTSKMMNHLFIALLPIIIFSCYKNGFMPYYHGYGTLLDAFRPLILIIVASLTSVLGELFYIYIFLKKREKSLFEYLKYSYAIYPGLFLALIIPLNTPISILIIGALFATIVGKMLFGGFGYNVFNPALIGSLFITSTYYSNMMAHGGYLNLMEVDTISKATPLTNLHSLNFIGTYQGIVAPYGNLWDFFLGFRPGSLGETSALLCLVAFIYLIITKVIKWRIPVIYITTVFILTCLIGFYYNLCVWYPIFQILSGGLMFGAIFMATDPVTSPTTPFGQIIYAVMLGILTVVFRFITIYPEGVLTAILTLNMLIFLIDKIGSKIRFDYLKMVIPIVCLILAMDVTALYISKKINPKEIITDKTFNVLNVNTSTNNTVYTVTNKGFHGLIKAEVIIDSNGKVTTINVLEQNENVWDQIESNNYIDHIIENQNNLDNLDTISGATYTSNYLKDLVTKTLKYYNELDR